MIGGGSLTGAGAGTGAQAGGGATTTGAGGGVTGAAFSCASRLRADESDVVTATQALDRQFLGASTRMR